MNPITIKTIVNAPVTKAWECYHLPKHVTQWNAAHESWHCPRAENDLSVGGRFNYRMEARDGSFGFDLGGVYTAIKPGVYFDYTLDDERKVRVSFAEKGAEVTEVTVVFEPESENPVEMQEQGWQAILDNFKSYTERA